MTFRHLYILLVACVAYGCEYDKFDRPELTLHDITPNSTFNALYVLSEAGSNKIVEDLIFEGRVVANDKSGNYYQSIVVQDGSGGVEVKLGFYDTAIYYPVGARVAIKAGGLSFTPYEGVMQLGREILAWSNYRVEPLGSRHIADKIVFVTDTSKAVEPAVKSIEELQLSDCGTLVRVEGVQYYGEHSDWGSVDYGSTAQRVFRDSDNNEIVVLTSSYADFASQKLPTSTVSIVGVASYGKYSGKDMFSIRIRDLSDIKNE